MSLQRDKRILNNLKKSGADKAIHTNSTFLEALLNSGFNYGLLRRQNNLQIL